MMRRHVIRAHHACAKVEMKKILSVIVPCYNSAAYMEHCIETLLCAGQDIEILIIDDGSVKDNTAEIADRLEREHEGIVRAIHQENKGHGGAVNTGIENAVGTYIKVVDSDDWVNEKAFKKAVDFLKSSLSEEEPLDMLVCNFVYEKVGADHKKIMHYHKALPRNMYFGWDDVRSFSVGQYILMHSVMYRKQVLIDCGLKLPEHTFYVDNLYVYTPLPYVKKMYYLDINLYRYFIGRDDQSVNEQVMISRIDQQLLVNHIMVDSYDVNELENKRLRSYMYQYLEIITVISSVLLLRAGGKENLQKKKDLWKYIKNHNAKMYKKLRYGKGLGWGVNLPGAVGRKTTLLIYKICQKIFGFN